MIKLNDILKLDDLINTKIRFNLMLDGNRNPIDMFKNGNVDRIMTGQYWNYKRNKSYKVGQINLGFIKINASENQWLLFHIGRVTKDLNILNGMGYEYESLPEYEPYIGRLIISYKNKSQMMIRNALSVIDDCSVHEILPDIFNEDLFPGYENIDLSWHDLARVLDKDTWKTALRNQKGVYLITDQATGKMYIGAAYGEDMLLNRWQAYVRTYHGGNVGLKVLTDDYIKQNFRYSILDIFKSTTNDNVILARENWWKQILLTRKFGYNFN
ncbi:GIY-YIG nuclease family protein [Wohlfahrtiimonas chitiniclastica]|uniref:GIY-YIG nuclease family protein n=1 Tax=Wohlfahrtiimonas chitiniclastica TaxID=400946 RepID=UPI000374BD6F|nr:GIY-YIG nuclease family protein [Wohlfahrtiimonas chitiniclastica]